MGLGMAVEVLTRNDAAVRCVEQLGLVDRTRELNSPEALAAALRRAASFVSPTGPGTLVRLVERAAVEVVDEPEELRERLSAILDALIGYGDLVELPSRDDALPAHKHLYLGPPAFVRRRSGSFLLLGVRPDAVPLVSEELVPLVEYEGHVRAVRDRPGHDVESLLLDSGLREVAQEAWLRSPRIEDPETVIRGYDSRLSSAGPSGEIEGLTILDPASKVTYYRGRWRAPSVRDEGRFVGRRPQAFGADLWCYVELTAGSSSRLVDLPVDFNLNRGCDEAWRLQAALDAVRGQPQRLRVRPAAGAAQPGVIDLFSPIPRWLQRRWDSLATPTRSAGALCSYSFAPDEVAEEAAFAAGMLWLEFLGSDAPRSDAN